MFRDFYAELKRRNVFRVAAAYVLVAWLTLQATDVLMSLLELPGWVGRFVLLMLVIGFVLAVLLSWVYELTPEGVKREEDVDRSASVTQQTGRKLDFVIIGVLGAAVAYFVVDKFFLATVVGPADEPATAEIAAAQSIAVLPFANMSSDEENEFFADGLTEELLNVLAKIDGLLVTGRTSSFYFKDKNEDLRLIGRQLGVAHILEGSVRKSGPSVRITAQLIKADDGFHLWSETYDRRLDDIFAIQDEIASAVAAALRTRLLGEDESVVEAQAEIAPEIYARFIAAKSRSIEGGRENLVASHEALEKIVQEAPDYAPAHAALAITALQRWRRTRTISATDARAIARNAVEQALELAPDNDYVLTAYGVYLSELVENATDAGLRRVNEVFRRALEINPENVEAMWFLAFNLRYMEEYDEAIELLDRALRIDPLDRGARNIRIWALTENGRIDEAIEYAMQSREIFPDELEFYFLAGLAETGRGRPDRALAWIRKLEAGGEGAPTRKYALARQVGYQQGAEEAMAALRSDGNAYADIFEAGEARDYARALTLVEEAIERDGWAEWEVELFFAAILAGRCGDAFESRFAARLWREWSEGDPAVDSTNDNRAIWTAFCLHQRGEEDQAEKLLRAALDYAQPRPGRFDDPILRARRITALAMLGDRKRSIEEWQAYYDAGFGTLSIVPYEDHPGFDLIVEDPEFQRILSDIEARNSRRLERMIANDWSVDTPL
jgi:TolB-like protein